MSELRLEFIRDEDTVNEVIQMDTPFNVAEMSPTLIMRGVTLMFRLLCRIGYRPSEVITYAYSTLAILRKSVGVDEDEDEEGYEEEDLIDSKAGYMGEDDADYAIDLFNFRETVLNNKTFAEKVFACVNMNGLENDRL